MSLLSHHTGSGGGGLVVYGEDDLNRTIDVDDKKSGHEESPESNLVSRSLLFRACLFVLEFISPNLSGLFACY